MMNFVNRHLIGVSAFVVGLWVVFRLLGWPFSFVGGCLLLGWFGYLTWASRAVWIGWIKARFTKRRPDTPGRLQLEQETATMLGVMADAASAPGMSDEQRIMLSQSLTGMRMRTDVLLRIPNRSLAEERELQMITRETAKLEGRPQPAPTGFDRMWSQTPAPRPLAALGAANPLAAILMSPTTWLAGAFLVPAAFAGVQTMRLNNAKDDLADVRGQLSEAVAERDQWRADYEEASRAVVEASQQAQQTTETIERERARVAAARRRERELTRDIQERTRAIGDAPTWSLRADEPLSLGPSPDLPTAADSG